MAETLGSLCDKLTIVQLKVWHSEDPARISSLNEQSAALQEEMNRFMQDAISGHIPAEKLTFAANKVYKRNGNEIQEASGTIGQLFAELAAVNCELWHEQEKVYDFAAVPVPEKDGVVRSLAHLNLRRNQCIDAIDRGFRDLIRIHHDSDRQSDS
jgi:hypothetical protein